MKPCALAVPGGDIALVRALQSNFVVRSRADRSDLDRYFLAMPLPQVGVQIPQRSLPEGPGLVFVRGVHENIAGDRGDKIGRLSTRVSHGDLERIPFRSREHLIFPRVKRFFWCRAQRTVVG